MTTEINNFYIALISFFKIVSVIIYDNDFILIKSFFTYNFTLNFSIWPILAF